MLLSALGTSIANGLTDAGAGIRCLLPGGAVVVLAYLLAVTTLVVSAGRLGDTFGLPPLWLAGWVCSPWPRPCAAWRPPSAC
jgi:hypothetical protein